MSIIYIMSGEVKEENKLYNLNEDKKEIIQKKCISKEDLKIIKIVILIIFGLFLTIFLFGAYIFHSYNIEYSDTAFDKQELNDCYIN